MRAEVKCPTCGRRFDVRGEVRPGVVVRCPHGHKIRLGRPRQRRGAGRLLVAGAALATIAVGAWLLVRALSDGRGEARQGPQGGTQPVVHRGPPQPAGPPPPPPGMAREEVERIEGVVARSLDAVVWVEADGGNGSGFVADAAGRVVTCLHVVEDALDEPGQTVWVRFRDQTRHRATHLVALSEADDVAVLRTEATGRPVLELRADDPPPLQPAAIIGHPAASPFQRALGRVAGRGSVEADLWHLGPDLAVARRLVVTIPADPGNSGGPILDPDGRVVGIAAAVLRDIRNHTFAVPAAAIRRVLLQKARPVELRQRRAPSDAQRRAAVAAHRARRALAAGDAPRAIALYREATKLDPRTYRVWLDFGRLLSREERWPEAEKAFRRAATLRSGRVVPDILFLLALASQKHYLRIASFQDHWRANAHEPALSGIVLTLFGHAHMAREAYPKALEAADAARTRDPRNLRAVILHARATFSLGQHDDAIGALRGLRKRLPNHEHVLFTLGLMLAHNGDIPAATRLRDELLAMGSYLAAKLAKEIDGLAEP